ncbi:MAG: hypothetical protein FWH24_06270, partial [Oscillospiraceae bacterium]|nr:hypothetical protein [Oscillospiraceae bacterium]
MIEIILKYLKEKKLPFKENESLKEYAAFQIGGTAELLVMPEDPGCLAELFGVIKENKIDYYILGNGSNVLIAE